MVALGCSPISPLDKTALGSVVLSSTSNHYLNESILSLGVVSIRYVNVIKGGPEQVPTVTYNSVSARETNSRSSSDGPLPEGEDGEVCSSIHTNSIVTVTSRRRRRSRSVGLFYFAFRRLRSCKSGYSREEDDNRDDMFITGGKWVFDVNRSQNIAVQWEFHETGLFSRPMNCSEYSR
ncbi:hypothetical protein AVEN_203447-1 [Araneus ventricosus]|uniref:Uncharacterized protein n=1 Tax=Araneus ventricosus TaxID=182803 RepID=A0A4Y2BGB4_ARAVE|nr:hypothetical protein AVEN_203447-1 [Araneus ventricosus]